MNQELNLLESTLTVNAYWMVNKAIAKALKSVEAAIFLSDLISKRQYFRTKGWLDEQGGFFNTAQNIEEDLFFTEEKRLKLTKLLVAKGLLKVIKKGLPSKNFYYINDYAVLAIFSQSPGKQGDLSPENPGQSSPEKPVTNNNKRKTSNNNNPKTTEPERSVTSKILNTKEENTEITDEQFFSLVNNQGNDQKEPSQSLAKDEVIEIGLTQEEFNSMAELKNLDDNDMGFLADVVGKPIQGLTSKQKERLTKTKNKVANLKKAYKFRPVDQEELQYQRETELKRKARLLEFQSLSDDRKRQEARNYLGRDAATMDFNILVQRVETEIMLLDGYQL